MAKFNMLNPYERIAGTQALIWGFIGMSVAAITGSFGSLHFDGALDIHIGEKSSLWFFLIEGYVSWFSISLFLTLASLLFSRSKFRIIDILGTQAFARILLIPVAVYGACFSQTEASKYLLYVSSHIGEPVPVSIIQLISFGVFMFLNIITIIWMIVWMFQGYKVSSNLKGVKAIASFIVAILLAEVLSKTVLYLLTN